MLESFNEIMAEAPGRDKSSTDCGKGFLLLFRSLRGHGKTPPVFVVRVAMVTGNSRTGHWSGAGWSAIIGGPLYLHAADWIVYNGRLGCG